MTRPKVRYLLYAFENPSQSMILAEGSEKEVKRNNGKAEYRQRAKERGK
jgi:hypothetical protein